MVRRSVPVACVLACLSIGCTSAPPPRSCVVSASSVCIDFIAASGGGSTADTPRIVCSALSGSFSETSSCPTNDRVGRCTQTTNDTAFSSTYTNRWSYYPPNTTLSARGQCPPSMPEAHTTYEFEEN